MYVIKTPYLQKYVCYNTTIFRDKHDGVITVIEPDIQECEVKWALEASLQTKLMQVMEFQLSYFKS